MQKSLSTCLFVFVFVGLVVLGCAHRNSQRTTTTNAHENSIALSNDITYDVIGNGTKSSSVTYSNQGGGTEQQEVSLPWSKSFTAGPGDFLYISAQNKEKYGEISVRISVNGRIRKASTSGGAFVVASADLRCCDGTP